MTVATQLAVRVATRRRSARLPIRFCPYCGTDLRAQIDANAEEFDELTKKHAPFDPGWGTELPGRTAR